MNIMISGWCVRMYYIYICRDMLAASCMDAN